MDNKNIWDDSVETLNKTSNNLLGIFQNQTEPLVNEVMESIKHPRNFNKKVAGYCGELLCECKWLYKHVRTLLLDNHQLEKENLNLKKEIVLLKSQSNN